MDTTQTYKTIERYVTAIQYTATEENLQAIIEFAGDFYLSGILNTNVGDWIVRKNIEDEESLEFEVLTDEEFQLNYRQSTPPASLRSI